RISVKPSARNNSSAMYCGATQMLGIFGSRKVVVSSAPSAARACGARMRPTAPAAARPPTKRRRVWISGIGSPPLRSRLQLAFQLVEEAPVGAVGDDLLRARLDEAQFMQTERVKPQRILRVVFPPFIVGELAQRLESIVIPTGKAAIDEHSGDPRRL